MRVEIRTQGDAEDVMLKVPKVTNLRHWSKLYSAEPHLAGDLDHAERIRDLWITYGIPSKLVRYDVLQNFPLSASLALHSQDQSIKYKAILEEPELPEDPTSNPKTGFLTFHGFGANGDVTAKLVYANFGTLTDFEVLASRGVSVEGCIVICKYSKVFRGLKVRAAEKYGAVGVIIYSDPQEDGEFTTANGYEAYPHGPARHPESVQRGSVDFFSVAVGDPTTPGYPSKPGDDTERRNPGYAIPGIPSLPISFSDALPFLKALDGLGLSAKEIGGDWKGCLDVEYYCGPSLLEVSLSCKSRFELSPIYNVIGILEGSGDETIILGNHHDSWCCGAVDPVSGSAAMNEVARGLGMVAATGWKMERTIILASWDNEEYGLVGSTEWAEENADWLTKTCVAYINVDESTNGGEFFSAVGSPLLADVLREVARLVPSPISPLKTVYDDWLYNQQSTKPKLPEPLVLTAGTGSDYTVMLDHLGIPSLDIVFSQKSQAVYPYHSNYDSYHWIDKFGDVGFKKHLAMARLWGVLAIKLAAPKVIPFKALEYPTILASHASSLAEKYNYDMSFLLKSLQKWRKAANQLDAEAQVQRGEVVEVKEAASAVNYRYMSIERAFLSKDGLPGRTWFKHIIFAPGLWLGYDGVVFPGLLESLDAGDFVEARNWMRLIADAIDASARKIAM